MNDDRERLLEEVTTAWRAGGDTGLAYHPAWHDLDEDGRREAFERTALLRTLESALDPDGLSSTGRRVMALIDGGR
jgi:hypothetical protein